ncbi:MAG: hypothetical protein GX043_11595 [Desulfovibrionales bacterium]|jgi:hypothetical protein|nr:hypothetical protein [Desulfovibrionales bacterium]
MVLETNQCTSEKEEVLDHMRSYFNSRDYDFAQKIIELVFELNNDKSHRNFQIRAYVTGGEKNDIRFCIDRGSDCDKIRKQTAFFILRKQCEIHVRDSGADYLKPQSTTDFSTISGGNARIIGIKGIKKHMVKSFCKMVRKLGLSSDLCM